MSLASRARAGSFILALASLFACNELLGNRPSIQEEEPTEVTEPTSPVEERPKSDISAPLPALPPRPVDAGQDAPADTSTPEVLAPLACPPGWADCNTLAADVCEAELTSIATCGSCAVACAPPPPNATVRCEAPECVYACVTGFANCNKKLEDGCEVDLL